MNSFDISLNLILILLINTNIIIQTQLFDKDKFYVISNQRYPNEYLVNSGIEGLHSIKILSSESLNSIKWKFKKINGSNDTYFIKSLLNDEHICTSSVIFGFDLRQYVVLRDLEKFKYMFPISRFEA